MENIVVSTFRSVQDATLGLNKLKDLDQLNDIDIYNIVMIRKTSGDKFEFLYKDGPDTRDLPVDAALAGTLIGVIGGPIGMAVGMLTGAMVGAADEDDTEDLYREFLNDVNKQLAVGTVAIVLDVEEDGELMINSYLEPFNGVVVRRDIAAEFDKYDQEQERELNEEIEEEERRLKEAREENKAAVRARIAKLKSERDERTRKIRERNARTKEHLQNKIKALDDRWKAANAQMKEKIALQRDKIREKLGKMDREIATAFENEAARLDTPKAK